MCTVPRFCRFRDSAYFPSRATANSVGYDLRITEDTIIPNGTYFVDVGVGVLCPDGSYGQLFSRSGLAKMGIITMGGVIDPDYRGSIGVILHNHGAEYAVRKGDAISQLVFLKHAQHQTYNTKEISVEEFQAHPTLRGDKGFGSSSTLPPPVEPVVPVPALPESPESDSVSISSYYSNPEYVTTWDRHIQSVNPAFRHLLAPMKEMAQDICLPRMTSSSEKCSIDCNHCGFVHN